MKKPKISVIIAYQDEKNFKSCLESIINQTFDDIEIICVGNNSNEENQLTAVVAAEIDDRIKLVNLPNQEDKKIAKKTAIGLAEGDFICFLNPDTEIDADYIRTLAFEFSTGRIIETKENHLYRRDFLENDEEISKLVQDRIESEFEKVLTRVNEQKNNIKEEFDKFYRCNTETIKNNAYEIICRFNQLEKTVFEKDYQNQQRIDDAINNIYQKYDCSKNEIYDDISKVYEYINSQVNQKRSEIDKVYEEITKNYSYTEQLIVDKTSWYADLIEKNHREACAKFDEIEKDITSRYVTIKHLMDMQGLSEQNGNDGNINVTQTVSENIDNIYSRLNEATSAFYKELSDFYKDINEKLMKRYEENKYYTDVKISELREEFEANLLALKQELGK